MEDDIQLEIWRIIDENPIFKDTSITVDHYDGMTDQVFVFIHGDWGDNLWETMNETLKKTWKGMLMGRLINHGVN